MCFFMDYADRLSVYGGGGGGSNKNFEKRKKNWHQKEIRKVLSTLRCCEKKFFLGF